MYPINMFTLSNLIKNSGPKHLIRVLAIANTFSRPMYVIKELTVSYLTKF